MSELKVNYSDEPVEKGEQSIFLAGPTPRNGEAESWRPEAVETLRKLGYTGLVYVPERKSDPNYNYDEQVEWEWEALHNADAIAFWIPRDIKPELASLGMPAFTTNVEFGFHLQRAPEKVAYGRPDDSQKNRYLDHLYKKQTGRDPSRDLETLMQDSIERTRKDNEKF